MKVHLNIQRDVIFHLPYDMTLADLRLEEGSENSDLQEELEWLSTNATPEELPRILQTALILHNVASYPIADCLNTAIIWERG